MMNEDLLSDDYRILILSRPHNPLELSAVFQDVLQLHPTDAALWSRKVPGILDHRVTGAQARALIAAISALGLTARAVQHDEIPNLHQALTIHHLRPEENGLQVIELHGTSEVFIPWQAIQMICVGEVPSETAHHAPPGTWSGLSAGRHYQRPDISLPLTPSLLVCVTCAAPYPHLQFHHDRMNYEYLGSRLTVSATTNFQHLIKDLTEHATAAMLTESTLAYLTHVKPEDFRFKDAEHFFQYANWHACLARESKVAAGVECAPRGA